MKKLIWFIAICFLATAVSGQTGPVPQGASKFILELGGLDFEEGRPDLVTQIAGNNIDSIEAGGGPAQWTIVQGRVFLTRHWMIEIGKVKEDYSMFNFDEALAKIMQKRLEAEGFKLTPAEFKLASVRYKRGTTVGTVEVRSFFLNSGNVPLRMEFIFNESYLQKSPSEKKPK